MIQTLRLLNFFIFSSIASLSLGSTPYIIYTSNSFSESANLIKNLHTEIIPDLYGNDPFDVIIKYKEQNSNQDIIDFLNEDSFNNCYLLDESECSINETCDWVDYTDAVNIDFCYNPKYLLIIGDENIISSPIAENCGQWPAYSDDFFNLDFSIGRIISSNNQEALNQINKIINYLQDDNSGNWKNKILLLADNEFTNNPNSFETEHSEYTSHIYNIIKNESIVNTLYATEYEIFPSNTQPQLTEMLINTINSGIGIINYIGHGTNQSLAHEQILKLDRDLELFNTDNKPPIWIVGTCGFGEYINTSCMAEELLQKDDSAIAVLSTTVGISEQDNSEYLINFYNSLSDFINNKNDFRLGDLFRFSKKSIENTNSTIEKCVARRFQFFGDPALPIMFARKATDEIVNIPNDIFIGSSNLLTINHLYSDSEESYIKIIDGDIINQIGDINYSKPGATLFESSFTDNIEYFLPIDLIADNLKFIITSQDSIQIESGISTSFSFDSEILNDTQGPNIKLYNNNIKIQNNMYIAPPYQFLIDISDTMPINLSGYNYHYLKFWINDDKNNSIILNDLYYPKTNTSGVVSLNFEDTTFEDNLNYILNIEAWDILNNHTIEKFNINIRNHSDEVFNIYNFPNPFSKLTYFTFHIKNPQPIKIHIDIFSKKGTLINSFSTVLSDSKSYHVFPDNGWDGTDKYGNKILNGTYFYNLKITNPNGKLLHNQIHNITLLN